MDNNMIMKTKKMVLALAVVAALLTGCSMDSDKTDKIRDLDFTVVSEDRQPEELKQILEEKKMQEFKITYVDGEYLYICIGYGEQITGGYSIAVKELYLTENAVYVSTNLLGPSAEEKKKEGVSYPYIVVKCENVDKTVVFN